MAIKASFQDGVLTLAGITLPQSVQPSDDYAIFTYYEPNATGGQIAHFSVVPAPIMASAQAWMATQKNSDGTPKYTDVGNLVSANATSGLLTAIETQFPPIGLLSAIQKIQAAQSELKDAVTAQAETLAGE